MKIRNFAGAAGVAIVLALALVKPVVAGVDSWKIVLAVAGLLLFVAAGMSRS